MIMMRSKKRVKEIDSPKARLSPLRARVKTTSRFELSQNSQSGQMAIFIALIFQILFVFFAMVINVGLVVHDKINLQNAVDFAAYYGASKQAELLNAIAHSNYQIRQAWKLLAFRYRVAGSFGHSDHPLSEKLEPTVQEEKNFLVGLNGDPLVPTICVTHSRWQDFETSDESLCHKQHLFIPRVPTIPVIAGFWGWNPALASFIETIKAQYNQACKTAGAVNWGIAAAFFYAYKADQASRKRAIYGIAESMSNLVDDFVDLQGDSVMEGMRKTFEKNLTEANRASIISMSMFNSLAHPALGGSAQERARKWLPTISIAPAILYSSPVNPNAPDCDVQSFFVHNTLSGANSKAAPELEIFMSEPSDRNNVWHSSLGVEKNPWAFAYVGFTAKTSPRKPFAPFGGPTLMSATAFAKPFGGRIGPWLSQAWGRQDPHSVGDPHLDTDPLAPPRKTPDGSVPEGKPSDLVRYYPNYSRFPGDQKGLASAREAVRVKHGNWDKKSGLQWSLYKPLTTGDLERDEKATPIADAAMGEAEMAAIAPNLFDITYYSVEADWESLYKHRLDMDSAKAKFAPDFLIRGDLKAGDSTNIKGQIAKAIDPNFSNTLNSYFYIVKHFTHLLTGWVPKGAMRYEFDETNFGRCIGVARGTTPAPGSCFAGGRVGYSVKIVARDYLNSQNFDLAGNHTDRGPILNPPPESFGTN